MLDDWMTLCVLVELLAPQPHNANGSKISLPRSRTTGGNGPVSAAVDGYDEIDYVACRALYRTCVSPSSIRVWGRSQPHVVVCVKNNTRANGRPASQKRRPFSTLRHL